MIKKLLAVIIGLSFAGTAMAQSSSLWKLTGGNTLTPVVANWLLSIASTTASSSLPLLSVNGLGVSSFAQFATDKAANFRSANNSVWSSATGLLDLKAGSSIRLNSPVNFFPNGDGNNIYVGDIATSFWDGGTINIYTDSGSGADSLHFAADDKALEFWGAVSLVLGQTNFKMYYDSGNDRAVFSGKGLSGSDTTTAKWENALLFGSEIGFGTTNPTNWITVTDTGRPTVFQVTRTHTTNTSPLTSMNFTETLSWTGPVQTAGNLNILEFNITDIRKLTSGFGIDQPEIMRMVFQRNSTFSSDRTSHTTNVITANASDGGSYTRTVGVTNNNFNLFNGSIGHGFTYVGSAQTLNYNFKGISIATNNSPTITSGTVNSIGAIFEATGTGYLTGNSYVAAFHNTMTNFDTTFFLANTTSNNSYLGRDDARLGFGTGSNGTLANRNIDWDAEIYYDNTNLIVNPKVLGTGKLRVLGNIQADSISATSTLTTAATSTIATDFALSGSNRNYFVKVGTNNSTGTTTLSSGTATVNNTLVRADSLISLTLQNCSTCGSLSVGTKTVGTSFVINSTNVLDASDVYYEIKQPLY